MEGKETELTLELLRRLDQIRETEGDSFEYEIDRKEWTSPRYFHQN